MLTKLKNIFSSLLGNKAPTDGTERYEEVSEKQTTKAGYFLLLVMFVFLLVAGESSLTDFSTIPTAPVSPSSCVSTVLNTYSDAIERKPVYSGYAMYYGDMNGTCNTELSFSDLDREFKLDALYNKISPQLVAIRTLDQSIQSYQDALNQNNYQQRDLRSSYDLSLQEKMANEPGVIDKSKTKESLALLISKSDELQAPLLAAQTEKTKKVQEITPALQELWTAYDSASKKYETQMSWYRVLVFLAELAFALPLFMVITRWYLVLKRKNSKSTVIALSAFAASTILFAQVMLSFLYDIIPHTWFLELLAMFQSIAILRYVLYYGTVALVIGIFGGIVYLIQKRLFDHKVLAIRRLKSNKCPSCEFTLNDNQDFCARCGVHVREKCMVCNGKRFLDLPFCPECGSVKK
jgi:hypothetical protein